MFIKKASAGLACMVEEGDYDSLVGVMMHLLAVKDRQAATDNMFEPLKQTIELLKSYDQELSDDVHQQLQELPEQWNAVKKQSMVVKQDVAPLQTTEANNIRRKANTFDVRKHTAFHRSSVSRALVCDSLASSSLCMYIRTYVCTYIVPSSYYSTSVCVSLLEGDTLCVVVRYCPTAGIELTCT